MKTADIIITIFLIIFTGMDLKLKKIRVDFILLFLIVSAFLMIMQNELFVILAAGIIPGAFLFTVSFFLSPGIGKADALIFLGIGAVKGVWNCFYLMLIALGLSSIYSIILLVVKKKNRKYEIPFVPFILFAYLILMAI